MPILWTTSGQGSPLATAHPLGCSKHKRKKKKKKTTIGQGYAVATAPLAWAGGWRGLSVSRSRLLASQKMGSFVTKGNGLRRFRLGTCALLGHAGRGRDSNWLRCEAGEEKKKKGNESKQQKPKIGTWSGSDAHMQDASSRRGWPLFVGRWGALLFWLLSRPPKGARQLRPSNRGSSLADDTFFGSRLR